MSRLRRAAKATLVAQVFNWAALLLSLVTVPLYLNWLGQERYGLLLTGLAFAGYLMFSDAGLSWASMLLIAQANGRADRGAIAAIVRSSFSLAACSALLVVVIVAIVYWVLQRPDPMPWLPYHPEFGGLMLAIGCSAVCSLAFSPFYNLLIGLQETHLAAAFQGGGRLLGAVLAVAVASANAPLGLVFSGNVAGALVAGLLAAVHCRRRHAWAFRIGPMWETGQIRQQLRTGAKSFAMQVGSVLWGTAPVLAISSCAGPQFVPFFSIPLTLLNAPFGLVSSFSASLQPGYGEAIGRGETKWVADTVRRILRQVLAILGLLSCGFLLLAAPFVRLWTGGRIDLLPEMLAGVLAFASAGLLLGVFRYALTGINRHRSAALYDLLGGALAMGLGFLVVQRWGYEWVGFGVAAAVLLTSGWMLSRELRRALHLSDTLWPTSAFWLRWAAIVGCSFGAGWLTMRWSASMASWLTIVVAGVVIGGLFALLVSRLLPEEVLLLRRLTRRFSARAV